MAATHCIPYALDADLVAHYEADSRTLLEELKQHGRLLEVFEPHVHNPWPMAITLQSFTRMKAASGAMHRGMIALVNNWAKDERLHKGYLRLSDRARQVLALVEDSPYQVGSWRPDFLFPASDAASFQVCEINARFPFNAFYASHEKNGGLSSLPYLQGVPVMPVSELEMVPQVFTGVFDESKSVGVVKEKGGWDVFLFQESFNAAADAAQASAPRPPPPPPPPSALLLTSEVVSGSFPRVDSSEAGYRAIFSPEIRARMVPPAELRLSASGQLCDSVGPLDQFALECSQTALLALPADVLAQLLKSTYINDIRTILIAHDKRLLAALTDAELMSDYLAPEDVALLQTHVVKTFVVECLPEDVRADALANRAAYLLKPNGEGKGEGIVFGNDAAETDTSWAAHLSDPAKSCYVLQPRVAQREFDIHTRTGPTRMLVVGLLHNFNDAFLGPGIFRASTLDNPIVNVAGGKGIILSPVVLSCRWQLSRLPHTPQILPAAASASAPVGESAALSRSESKRDTSAFAHLLLCEKSDLRFDVPAHLRFDLRAAGDGSGGAIATYPLELLASITTALSTDGICLLDACWSQEGIDANMVSLVSQFGIINSHNAGGMEVWDVKPLHVTGGERSHTSEEFPMHTDESFGQPPPRFMCLYVVRDDARGGGLTTLVDTATLMRYISRASLAVLHTTEFTIKVPREFHKGQDTVRGRILSADKLWRYRSDIVMRTECTPEQIAALDELDACLCNPHLILTTKLPRGSMLLLDNSRWFHGRTRIFDENRWLKRIRFHPPSYTPDATSAFAAVLQKSLSMGIGGPVQEGCAGRTASGGEFARMGELDPEFDD